MQIRKNRVCFKDSILGIKMTALRSMLSIYLDERHVIQKPCLESTVFLTHHDPVC